MDHSLSEWEVGESAVRKPYVLATYLDITLDRHARVKNGLSAIFIK